MKQHIAQNVSLSRYGQKTEFPAYAALFLTNFCISAHEGPRQRSDTAKLSQLPQLYPTYEATYALN